MLHKLKHQQKALVESHGSLRSVAHSEPGLETPKSDDSRVKSSAGYLTRQIPDTAIYSRRKRAASPVSISEAAALASQQGSRKRRLVSGGTPSSSFEDTEISAQRPSHSRLQIVQTSTPITPYVDKGGQSRSRKTTTRQEHDFDTSMSSKSSSTLDEPGDDEDNTHMTMLSKAKATKRMFHRDEDNDNTGGREIEDPPAQTSWRGLDVGSAMTPRMDNDGDDGHPQLRQPDRPRPSVLDTAAAQDASLPSPSLSPVTAAANMQSRRGYFELPNNRLNSFAETLQSLPSESQDNTATRAHAENPLHSQNVHDPGPTVGATALTNGFSSNRSLMSIPSMVEHFEAMPEEMKKYLMYQFLRRSSKKVLHFTAEVVNPALKCDFLELLPTELSLNVIGNLDAKTLCRAAQVSKRWRHLIDSSETVWKRLFDADHYVIPEGELQRAVREGWGWQCASQPNEYELDLSAISGNVSDMELSGPPHLYSPEASQLAIEQAGRSITQSRSAKRKSKSKSKPSTRKHKKRVQVASINSMEFEDEVLLDMASAEGPYAAAKKAIAAVPNPHLGLPSLRNLHVFKSIYMRHHLIRKTWMQDEKDGVTPRHIAFRAHQRHVVTCLQFDADKILTGSDDARINVYDTKTGALRNILNGHEGGVWALQYEGNVLVSGSTDRTVRVWDIEKGECTHVFQGHTSTVRCLQILMPTSVSKTPDGRAIMMPKEPLIITGSRDSQLRVWKLPKPGDPTYFQLGPAPDDSVECPYFVRALVGHHHSVRAIAAHADILVSGSYDCSVRVWKISTGETVHRLNGHAQKVYSVVLDVQRNRCISGSMDNYVKVWSLDTGAVLFNLEGHSSLVGLLDLQQDRLVSAAADSTLRIWDPENGHCKSTLSAHTGAITCFQHDGQKVISGSDRTLKMWNVASGEFAKDLLTDLSGVWQVKFNERRCVAAVQRNNLTYIEVSPALATERTTMLTLFEGTRLWRLARWSSSDQTRQTYRRQHRRTRGL